MTAEFEGALFTRLSTFAGLVALVGTRVWPDFIPDQTHAIMPAIVLTVGYDNDPMLVATGEQHARPILECYSTSKAELLNICKQLRLCLHGHSGTFGDYLMLSCILQSQDHTAVELSPGQPLYGAQVIFDATITAA